jgi:hypothetical protein
MKKFFLSALEVWIICMIFWGLIFLVGNPVLTVFLVLAILYIISLF